MWNSSSLITFLYWIEWFQQKSIQNHIYSSSKLCSLESFRFSSYSTSSNFLTSYCFLGYIVTTIHRLFTMCLLRVRNETDFFAIWVKFEIWLYSKQFYKSTSLKDLKHVYIALNSDLSVALNSNRYAIVDQVNSLKLLLVENKSLVLYENTTQDTSCALSHKCT